MADEDHSKVLTKLLPIKLSQPATKIHLIEFTFVSIVAPSTPSPQHRPLADSQEQVLSTMCELVAHR
jgi:hypothetical protein